MQIIYPDYENSLTNLTNSILKYFDITLYHKTLKELGKIENISLGEMIFFGNGLNDLEVIDGVGLGVAMGNALDEIKDKSKEVTETNNNDGIVKFLEEKLNSQKVKKI